LLGPFEFAVQAAAQFLGLLGGLRLCLPLGLLVLRLPAPAQPLEGVIAAVA
jgi:hypothetical protein